MTTKTTRWSPDSCSCVFEYTWDDAVAESSRTHTLSTVINKCPTHTSLANATCYSTVLDENSRKNIALERCLATGPTGLYDTVEGTRQLKPTITYNYSWSGTAPNRLLTISFTGISLTTNQKNTIQSAINTRLGSGKVTLV